MRVIICDDDAVVVSSLEIVLGAQPDIEVVGTATEGAAAVRLSAELKPDIALLDIQMPGVNGLEAAEQILLVPTAPRVVFLTTFSDDEYIVRALALGAAGYLIKQDVAGVAPALRAVAAGRSVLEGEVLERAMAVRLSRAIPSPSATMTHVPVRAVSGGMSNAEPEALGDALDGVSDEVLDGVLRGAPPDLAAIFPQLTEREREVVSLISEGLDNREIAATAYMSEGTVRNHISSILAKLHLRNRTQIAVAYWHALT